MDYTDYSHQPKFKFAEPQYHMAYDSSGDGSDPAHQSDYAYSNKGAYSYSGNYYEYQDDYLRKEQGSPEKKAE